MKCFTFVALLLLLCVSPASASEHQCTNLESGAAVFVTGYLDSWKNMHLAYKQFRHCDEGGPAEGFSEADARLMADHWVDLPQALPIIDADPDFEKWVIRHLDETDDYKDLWKIDHLSQTACPVQVKAFCRKIHTQIQSLDSDYLRCIRAEDGAVSKGKHADPSCLIP